MGIINAVAHTLETSLGAGSGSGPGQGSGSGSGPGFGPRAGPGARNAVRWLTYGIAALVLVWALGSAWQGVRRLAGVTGPSTAGGGSAGAPSTASGMTGGAQSSAGGGTSSANPRLYEQALAQELESLLCQVQGAGRVRVSVSLLRGPVYVFGTNTSEDTRTTEERDSTGTLRTVTEVSTNREPVIVRDASQAEQPIVAEEERPTISGVLILAEGAVSSKVRLDLVRAVQALFPLPTHRIAVLPMGR